MTKPEVLDRSLVVLVVEDEFLVALDMMVMLENNGYRVAGPASTVAESFALIDSDRPDLALLDYRLRGSVVTPVADLLVKLSIPFVMATASEVEKLGHDSPFASAENVGKPVSETKLMGALKRAASSI